MIRCFDLRIGLDGRAGRVRILGLAVGALLTSGCVVGPVYQRPPTVADGEEPFVNAPGSGATVDPASLPASAPTSLDDAPWWRSLGDPLTDRLVAEALESNTDLRTAAARVLEAQAQMKQSRSSLFPELSVGAAANRSKTSFNLPQTGRVAVYSTTYSTDLNLSYSLDLFGKLKRTRQSAWAQLLARQEARLTVLHTVVAEVVRGRVRLSILGRAERVAEDIRNSRRSTLDSVRRRYESGLTNALDLRLAKENLAAAEAQLTLVGQQLEQATLALDVLVGRRPGRGEGADALLSPLPPVTPVPLGLPADLLDRRPDLRQAEHELTAGTALVGAAVADLFPSLSLTASGGSRSDSLGDLLSSESIVYNAVANLLAPIFDGGRRRAAVIGAEARVEQAAANYAGAVLRALREVEDALVRDRAGRDRLRHLEDRLEQARAADRMARDRYRRGVADLLQVLESERRLSGAEDAINAARGDLWNARIDLHLALGGDWRLPSVDEPGSPNAPSGAFLETPKSSTPVNPTVTGPTLQENAQ